MSSDKHSKTEKPTPKRKREARKEGQIARSPELMSWASLLVAGIVGKATVASAISLYKRLFRDSLSAIQSADQAKAMKLLGEGMIGVVTVVAPLTLALMAVGLIGNVAQLGWAASGKGLKPKFSRLNPAKGLKKLFSPQSAWEAAKSSIKLLMLTGVAWQSIHGVIPKLTNHGHMVTLGSLMGAVATQTMSFVRNAALLGLTIAALDYAMQRRKINKGLMMSKQEIKDESRQSEGDPHVKGQIRAAQRRMSRMRMMAEVARADAVVVNPTHVSVAIKYDPARGAPRVLAKGADALAARIRAEATAHGVPLVEDVPLARTLYKLCEVGDEIPALLYEAVARLLAFIFALKATGRLRTMGDTAHRPPQPFLPAELPRTALKRRGAAATTPTP